MFFTPVLRHGRSSIFHAASNAPARTVDDEHHALRAKVRTRGARISGSQDDLDGSSEGRKIAMCYVRRPRGSTPSLAEGVTVRNEIERNLLELGCMPLPLSQPAL